MVHELKGRLRPGCVPVFSTDGLKNYFYTYVRLRCALTAHFGKWELLDGRKPIWVLFSNFVYAQVIKHQKRRRTVEVERRILVREGENYRKRLKAAGLSGRINTSFVERLNPLAPPARAGVTIRQCVSKLTRRTWGPAHFTPELLEHLEYPCGALWWRAYYHFVRFHERMQVELTMPTIRKGKQQPRRHRRRTPATLAPHCVWCSAGVAAGLTLKRWTVKDLLSYPLP